MLTSGSNPLKENTLPSNLRPNIAPALREDAREDLSEYVAHLQLHMALQARNLVPTLTHTMDSRERLLLQTQATFEKHVSRQQYSEQQ
jgi:hypothetical protein